MTTHDDIPGYTRLAPRYTYPWPNQSGARRSVIAATRPDNLRRCTCGGECVPFRGRLVECRECGARLVWYDDLELEPVRGRWGGRVALALIVLAFAAAGAWALVGGR